MEDDAGDDEIHTTTTPVTDAAATPPPPPPQSNSLTLALPIQHHHKTPGREDCWSEGATSVLIDAWGERYLELSRGNLKQKHWQEVADIVTSREGYTKTPKTDVQCKNRIDTVKKKYKVEKARVMSGGGRSGWRFYDRLDELIGTTAAKVNSLTRIRSPSERLSGKRPVVVVDESDDDEESEDDDDDLPPESYKRARVVATGSYNNNYNNSSNSNKASVSRLVGKRSGGKSGSGSGSGSMTELIQAILKFGEAYEQAETAKMQQMVEMEKQRMKFAKEVELQRMQYFMKTQMELLQLESVRTRRRGPGNADSNGRREMGDNNGDRGDDNNDNDNNNSDCSN